MGFLVRCFAGIGVGLVLHTGAFSLMFVGPQGAWLAYVAIAVCLIVAWAVAGVFAGALSRAALVSMLEAFIIAGLSAAVALLIARGIAGWLAPEAAATVMRAAFVFTAAIASFVAAFRYIKYAD